MPMSIGVNLRVTGHCNQGGRKYMEDMFSVAYQQSSNDRELEYAFFGIFDGHGGGEAATFAKENLMDIIVKQKNFWSDKDEDVLRAIRDGYVNTHYAMWRELEKWPKTPSGLPSTAGTTASIAFIRKGKIYIGHVGDSGIILGYQEKGDPIWKAKPLTKDHKPECGVEMTRIHESGGKVVSKSGVPRVVWNRPRIGHKGPVRRSTHIDEIPFLAVARSLGDLWSYNSELNTFVVSPEPDVHVHTIDIKSFRCLIFGTDGLWNMLTPQAAVCIVQAAEKHNEKHLIASQQTGNGPADTQMWINPSKSLVDRALERWSSTRLRADNTSVVTLMLDPPGPSHVDILLNQKRDQQESNKIPEVTKVFVSQDSQKNVNQINSTDKKCPEKVQSVPYPFTKEHDPPLYSAEKHSYSPKMDFNNLEFSNLKSNLNSNKSVSDSSIQVAEISSSHIADENIRIEENVNIMNESIINEDDIENIGNTSTNEFMTDLNFDDNLLDEAIENSWLQKVPEAEQFSDSSSVNDIQAISTPHSQKLNALLNSSINNRPVCVNNASGTKRKSKSISNIDKHLQYKNATNHLELRRTRRNSTGMQTQRYQQQRRSLTPKATVKDGISYVSSKTKKDTKSLLENDDSLSKLRIIHSRLKIESKTRSNSGEPCSKKRARSEGILTDENNPINQKIAGNDNCERLRWSRSISDSPLTRNNSVINLNLNMNLNQERMLSSPNSFKRRNLEKKVTPIKTVRRSSLNRTSRISVRDGFNLRDWEQNRNSRTGLTCNNKRQAIVNFLSSIGDSVSSSKRWLRSDTIAATPTKTLRSRNVDLTEHIINPIQVSDQLNIVKPSNQLIITQKSKQAPTSENHQEISNSQSQVKSTCMPVHQINSPMSRNKQNNCKTSSNISNCNGSIVTSSNSTNPTISKRVKSPYSLSSRSLNTRSRIKRFSK